MYAKIAMLVIAFLTIAVPTTLTLLLVRKRRPNDRGSFKLPPLD
jgi:hypothetical protein